MTSNKPFIEDIAELIILKMQIEGQDISHLKLQKLLYYTQAWHMVIFNQDPLFNEVPQAWVNGPVYPSIYKKYKNGIIKKNADIDQLLDRYKEVIKKTNLTNKQIELIEKVIINYGYKSAFYLVYLTHSELPWLEARKGLAPYEKGTNPISLKTMYSYYKQRLQNKQQ